MPVSRNFRAQLMKIYSVAILVIVNDIILNLQSLFYNNRYELKS